MKRLALNAFVLLVVIIISVANLSAPVYQTPVEALATLPGRLVSLSEPVLVGVVVFIGAIGVCLIIRLIVKLKAKLVGILFVAAGAIAMLASGVAMVHSRVEDSGAAVYSERITQTLIEQIELRPIHSDRPQLIIATEGASNDDIPEDIQVASDEPEYLMIDGAKYIGILSIPALSIDLPVNRTWSYSELRLTPCRYSGSIDGNSLVIAAHSYEAHFKYIDTLPAGEAVILTDVEGVRHVYQIVEIYIVEPSSVEAVIDSDYDLTLFTCTASGKERVVVRCMRPE